jgi:predicted nucleotidyltransferase component of viral defense system/DNA-directed RNA polymerase subunit RPC12/RpoP
VIDRREIVELSREWGLRSDVVEKDYVLGWVLGGIFQQPELSRSWAFKGGTCLKKCFFETYRFSEDLDFTLSEAEHLAVEFLLGAFRGVAAWVYENSGVEIPPDSLRFEVLKNPRGGLSAQGRLSYTGPLQRRGDLPRIKLDLTTDEVLVLEPVEREVHHPYTDKPEGGLRARSYAFEEVFAEKLRALAERERPRDLYDVVHLYRHEDLHPDRAMLLQTFKEKCAFKGMELPSVESLSNAPGRAELEGEWESMLAHQLPVLPPFEQFWAELPAILEWLYSAMERAALPTIGLGAEASSVNMAWRPPSMTTAWRLPVPMEIIRFAAANRLCVDLAYQGKRRLIEPYSLRQTRQGALLLYAVKHSTGEIRAYRVDRIQDAVVTNTSFKPRFAVELTPSGPMVAPPTSRPLGGWRVSRSAGRAVRRPDDGPRHIYRCAVCGREFAHTTRESDLRKHKTLSGSTCPGRHGY